MDAATAGLIGAALGAAATMLKTLVDGYSTRRLEAAKAQWARASMVDTELRTHVASVAKELLSAQHSIEWLCSLTDGGSTLTTTAVGTYHTEIHATFPRLLGALATVSSLNERTYRDLQALADKLFAIDTVIADALRGHAASPAATSAQVAQQRAAATGLYQSLPVSIARIMRDARQ